MNEFNDEGGLRAPPELTGWRKAWWWFDFIILVKLARLRFIAVLALIGVVITQWDTLAAYYDKWTRPSGDIHAGSGLFEWFCPMHPTIIRDNAKDKCPICFMPLSKRKKGDSHVDPLPPGVVNRVQLSPYRVVLAGVQTWPVDYQPLAKEITAVGYVEFNERGQRTVAARVKGRIDELVANETGRMVRADDVLASLYSPELVVSAQTLLDASKAGDARNEASSRRRLQLLGISDDQIDEIVKRGTANTHLKIRSPISGHVINKYVREGQYVEEGMPLYDVADLSTVWIQAQVYEDDIAFLPQETVNHELPANFELPSSEPRVANSKPLHITATTRAHPNEVFHGTLAFIYPHADQNTRTVSVRFEVENPGHKLRPGNTATVTLKIPPRDVNLFANGVKDDGARKKLEEGLLLAVPESAVIDTGNQKIVYRESSPGVYEGVKVTLGPRMQGPDDLTFYPILAGLKQGERTVMAGSFLVDAETRLNSAAGSIYFGGSSGSKGQGSAAVVRPSTPEDSDAVRHAALARLSPKDRMLAEQQRKCPILGTDLGAMGTPVKVSVAGQPVFLCCAACEKKALVNPKETLDRVAELKSSSETTIEALPADSEAKETPSPDESSKQSPDAIAEADIAAALAELDPADQKLAEAQRFCTELKDSRLGSMGKPVKLMIGEKTVFLCCEGCEADARKDPAKTVEAAHRLRELHGDHQGNRP